MKPTAYLRQFLALTGSSLLAVSAAFAQATSGTWDTDANGNWTDITKWLGNTAYAEGTDNTATLGNFITGGLTITLNAGITIGNITAQDTTHDYTISGANTLTFDVTSGTPTVSVVANRTLTFNSTTLAGGDGLLLSGGRINIRTAVVSHTGGTTVDAEAVLTANNLGTGNWRLNNGVLSDYYRATTVFGTSSGLGTGNGQVQIYGNSGFGGGNGNSNWRIGTQNSVLKWGTVGEGATGFFNPTTLKFFSSFDNMGSSIYGQVTLQNGIDLNSGSRTVDVLQAVGPNAIHSSFAKIDAGIKDTGTGGSLTKTGGGNLLIAGTSDYNGSININAGAVRFDSIAAMSSTGNVQVNDGGILGVRVGGTGNWSGGTSGVGTLGGLIAGLGGAGTSTVSYSGNVGLLLDVTANTSSSATITNAGATSLALYKMGGSALTLSGNNSYSGGTFLQQGTIIADSANAIGTAGDITFRGGTLQYTGNSAATNYGSRIKNSASAITLNTNGQNVSLSGIASSNTAGLTLSGAGSLTLSGTNSYTGITLVNGGATLVSEGLGPIPGAITNRGTVHWQIDGGGTITNRQENIGRNANATFIFDRATAGAADDWTITPTGDTNGRFNAANGTTVTFKKGDNVTSGTSTVDITTGLHSSESITTAAISYVADGVNLRINGHTGSRGRQFTFSSNTDGNEIYGAMNDSNQAVSTTFTGTGTWNLSRAAGNGYTGGTTVSGGTLLVNNTTGSGTGTGAVTVQANGTLGGTGTISGAVNVTGVLSPGGSIESLKTGALTMNSGSTLVYEVADNTPTGADLLGVNGALSLTNVTLDLSLANAALSSGSWTVGDKLTLISYSGSAITSGFASYDDDTNYMFGSNEWTFNYDDTVAGTNFVSDLTGSNFVTLTAVTIVPEPSSVALLGSLGALLLLRRRR